MGIRAMVQLVMDRRAGRKGTKDKNKEAKNHAQNRAGHSLSHLVLPAHEDLLRQLPCQQQ